MKTDYLKEAEAIKDEIIQNRRHIHANAEVGFDLPKTVSYVKEQLASYGIEAKMLTESGITATIGRGEPVILFRADMDAIPGKEASGVDFAAKEHMHMCGHDMHTAMLLGAAKILKAREKELKGTVKFVFQPAEELLLGADSLIKAGLLENPAPEAAFMIHVNTQDAPGLYIKPGVMTTANNNFRITVKGKSAHGAMPELGVDATYIGAEIVTQIPGIVAREIPFSNSAVITTGHFKAGNAPNSIPEEAIIEGTIRSFDETVHAFAKERLVTLTETIAKAYRAEATVEFLSTAYVVNNDEALAELARAATKAAGLDVKEAAAVQASEDFSYIAKKIPSLMMMLGVMPEDNKTYPLHNEHAVFNEDSMTTGVAAFVAIAKAYLGG